MQTYPLKPVRTIFIISGATVGFGLLYSLMFTPFHPHALINSVSIGLIIGFAIGISEVFFFQKSGIRFRFSVLLLLRTFFYMIVIGFAIIAVIGVHNSLMYGTPLEEVFIAEEFKQFILQGEFFRIFMYAFLVSFFINFIRQVNRLLGQNVLINYITGKYHQPVEEERIIMFLDLQSSTSIAEKLGNKLYHNFLNDFFYDITPGIVEYQGEIYQYVGDEVVITWKKEKGFLNGSCINCFFRIAALIQLNEEKYLNKYGIIPKFKAGYHFGKVITGEIGDVKKEIAFHGDTVNTAARIRSECTKYGKNLLLSSALLMNLSKAEYLSPELIGKIRLRGKEEEIELYTIKEAA